MLSLTAGRAFAEDVRVLDYSYPDQSIWTTRLDSRGEADNPLLRVAAHLFEAAGIPWTARALPAARLFEYLRDGSTAFSMLVKSPALEKCCLVSRRPIAGTELRVYRHKGVAPVTARTDLTGKDVITIRGYSYGGLLAFINAPGHRIVNNVASSHQAAFAMLEGGRADYLLDYAGPAREILADKPIDGLEYDVVDRLNVYLVLSRTFPDAAKVMARLETAAATLRVDGVPAPNPD